MYRARLPSDLLSVQSQNVKINFWIQSRQGAWQGGEVKSFLVVFPTWQIQSRSLGCLHFYFHLFFLSPLRHLPAEGCNMKQQGPIASKPVEGFLPSISQFTISLHLNSVLTKKTTLSSSTPYHTVALKLKRVPLHAVTIV